VSDEMKKAIVVLIAVVLLLSLTGCGIRQKISEKVTEKITEGIIDKVGGDDVDIDLDDGKINVKDEDGTEWTMGGGEWPKDGAAALIPEFKEGTISAVVNSPEGCWIEIEEVDEKDFQQYVEALKNAGFDKNVATSSDEENVTYIAWLEEKASVSVSYSKDGTLFIIVGLNEEEE
jgi:uncharacterized lipoprotein NlpE involved in copper resistance